MKDCTKSHSLQWKNFIGETVDSVQIKMNQNKKKIFQRDSQYSVDQAIEELKTSGIESEDVFQILNKLSDVVKGDKIITNDLESTNYTPNSNSNSTTSNDNIIEIDEDDEELLSNKVYINNIIRKQKVEKEVEVEVKK